MDSRFISIDPKYEQECLKFFFYFICGWELMCVCVCVCDYCIQIYLGCFEFLSVISVNLSVVSIFCK